MKVLHIDSSVRGEWSVFNNDYMEPMDCCEGGYVLPCHHFTKAIK